MADRLQGLYAWAPVWMGAIIITSLVCFVTLSFFQNRSARFIFLASVTVVFGTTLTALPFWWRARRIHLEEMRRDSLKVEQTISWHVGETVSLSFVPPERHAYSLGLLSVGRRGLSCSSNLCEVKCIVEEGEQTVLQSSFPPFKGTTSWPSTTYDLIGEFKATQGKHYRITLHVQKAADELYTLQSRLAVRYSESVRESERDMDLEITSAIVECLLLTAYGVFVAGALKLANKPYAKVVSAPSA